MGVSVFLIALLTFISGALRTELVLILIGAVLLGALIYAFAVTLISAGLHRKRARALSARIVPEELSVGREATVTLTRSAKGSGRFFRIPGILIRYTVTLRTRDERIITHIFDPDRLTNDTCSFTVPERGAWYSAYDELYLMDALGFFRRVFRLPLGAAPRLLSLPYPAEEVLPLFVQSGGSEARTEPQFQRTDNLTDHRPYVPGDDPRRINWKLSGHGLSNELFVREGEPEPPPHSHLLILIDSQADPALYNADTGSRAVDLLCENALAMSLEYSGRGMDIAIGCNSKDVPAGIIRDGTAEELAAALAWPAALPLSAQTELPVDPDRDILILALPRTAGGSAEGESTALDRFLKKRGQNRGLEIIFLYEGENRNESAETCVRIYGSKTRIRASRVRV
jgi:uncharacterized protein (DUF58 family)